MRILVAIGLAVVAVAAASPAAAADQSFVSAYACYLQGGHVYRPAGTDIVARLGWAAKTRGLVQDYANAQTTTYAVNGGQPVDASDTWEISSHELGYVAWVYHDTGVVLAPGESMTFSTHLTISHRVLDLIVFADGDSGRPLFAEPGTQFDSSCTVTAY